MSLSNFPTNLILLEDDGQNNNNSPLETTSFSKQGEKEKEIVSDPILRYSDSSPGVDNEEYHPPTSDPPTSFERHGIASTNSASHLNDQGFRNSPLLPWQNPHPAPSDSYRSSDDFGHQNTYPSEPQQYLYPFPHYQPSTSAPYENNSSSTQSFDSKLYGNQVPRDRPSSNSPSIDGQTFNDQFASDQISSSRFFDSQGLSLHHKILDHMHGLELTPDGYPVLRPGTLTMSIIPPPTHDELGYLTAWIPQNGPEIENFFAQRPSMHRYSLKAPLRDQLHGVIRIMMFEQAAFQPENDDINHSYDLLCLALLRGYRIQYLGQAAELQCIAATQIMPSPPQPPIAGPELPSFGSTGFQSLAGGYNERVKATDEDLIKEWGGSVRIVNALGVEHERLLERRESSSVHNKNHPEAIRLMLYPPSTGSNLSDHDILQMVRINPVARHQRASDVYTDRGEYKRRYKRFTEMSDDILRREGLQRSWIPRTVSDRPSNSVERAERAIQLGLTGDHKLFADAAAERTRRAQAGIDGSNGRARGMRRRRS
ncbi:ddbcd92f-fda8-4b82-aaec-c9b31e34f7dc [Sclerotinia trifoliorum]|uniref:Ddbcd92f-fda8-4b82-aaec-c9b31e34f7dc n=1 Tax=Sclerotinia trifoliorum TaxID=28548 RepID=A0A8H2VUZ0_9HELO|nr:ddbcd92f-fda8-4b82-aaec-c9b31e34f7dc [Sclerotinia trifoliorum]